MIKAGKIKYFVIFGVVILAFVAWDILNYSVSMVSYPLYRTLSSMDQTTKNPATVSIVGSDYSELSSPTALTNTLTEVQIDSMVCKALDLQGSAKQLFTPGKKILIKPNIVGAVADGCGENTDTRVIKALVKYIHKKTGGNCSILIGEGSPRPMGYEVPYSGTAKKWTKLWDLTGYPTLLSQLKALGINVDTVNLNGGASNYITGAALTNSKENLEQRSVPNGGYATPQGGKYYYHKAITYADVYITVPVLKVHNPGITCALKNQIGTAPGNHYGFNKMQGVIADGRVNKLIHNNESVRDWTDEEIVDLSLLAGIDLVVVDATLVLNQQKTYSSSLGNQVRMNAILVGNDPVAVDNVAARITGFNPDDVDHIALAELAGMGTNNPDLITTVGSTIAHVYKRLAKLTSDSRLMFGQSNRKWLVSQSFTAGATPMATEFIADEVNCVPTAGVNGWSQPMYFFDDRIDLANYFNYTNNIVAYTFAYVYSPLAKSAVMWVGSDEGLKVYLNKSLVYNYNSSRSYDLVSEKIPVTLNQGYNTLLVKSMQVNGTYDFTLNICDVESDPTLEGNRVAGLKFYPVLNSTEDKVIKNNSVSLKCYPNPAIDFTTVDISSDKPQNCSVNVYDLGGRLVKRLANKNCSGSLVQLIWNLDNNKCKRVPAGHYIIMEEHSRQYTKVIVR
jgi:uncharacterized protein (DUF362 family)